MVEVESLEYLESEIAYQIANYNRSRVFYRSANFWVTLSTAALSALTTAFIGTSQAFEANRAFVITALFFSGGVTVLSAYDGFLRSKDLWVQYTDTWVSLIALSSQVKYEKAKYGDLTQTRIDEFYHEYEMILNAGQEKWRRARATASQTNQQSGSS